MKITTKRPVEIRSNCCGHSNADAGTEKPAKHGFFSKEKHEARVEKRHEKKEERQEKRAARRAKRGAHPLKKVIQNGVQWFQDVLHPVKKNADGTATKTLADGSTVPVDPKNLAQLPVPTGAPAGTGPIIFDKSDLGGKVPTAIIDGGVAKVSTLYKEAETTQVPNDAGDVEFYKNADVEDKPAGIEGMSTTTKVLIGVGALLTVVGIIYLVKRSRKGKS